MSAGNLGNEHPFLDINLIKEQLSLEEIVAKLKDILSKMSYARKTGNQPLLHQLELAQATYSRAQTEKLNEMFGGDDLEGKIDIS